MKGPGPPFGNAEAGLAISRDPAYLRAGMNPPDPALQARRLNLIVSCAENRVIGRNGRLPWSIPEDWRFFQERTAGQIVVLGHVCFDTWPGAVREGRRPVVVTSRPGFADPAVRTAPSLPEALAAAEALPGDIYVCGGQRIYEEAIALPRPMRLYLTLVHGEVAGDRYFPEWRHLAWREVGRRDGSDANWRYTFLTLER
jgi:dihydrofolate reductase